MSTRKIPSLDGLRAISLMMVIVAHLTGTRYFPRWLEFTSMYGNVGVRTFFVISGFLITSILLAEKEATGTVNVKQFYVCRAYRIFPAAAALSLSMIVLLWNVLSWKEILTTLTYTSNYRVPEQWQLRACTAWVWVTRLDFDSRRSLIA
jgi:peptidoglycan/LPS O-acetylase OafA/YrhL